MTMLIMLGCVDRGDTFWIGEGAWIEVDANDLCANGCAYDRMQEVRDVVLQTGGVAEVEVLDGTDLRITGADGGDTKLTVVGLDEEGDVIEHFAYLNVRRIDRATAYPRCNVPEPAEDAWILPPETEIYFRWSMSADNQPLYGNPGIDFGAFEVYELDMREGSAWLESPAEAGPIEVTMDAYAHDFARFEVHDGTYDGLVVDGGWAEDAAVEAGETFRVQTSLTVDGRSLCVDEAERTVEVLTPEVCGLNEDGDYDTLTFQDPGLFVYTYAAGTCELALSAEGFDASVEVEVF